MVYDYVRRAYGVDPVPGHRAHHHKTKRHGTIANSLRDHHYVYVLFDGDRQKVPCHPTELDYLGAPDAAPVPLPAKPDSPAADVQPAGAGKEDPARAIFELWHSPDHARDLDFDPKRIASDAFMAGTHHERQQCAFVAETHSGFWDAATIKAIAQSIRERGLGEDGEDAVHLTPRRYAALQAAEAAQKARSYQARVRSWVLDCFGEPICYHRQERSHRFLEEAVELAQSIGCNRDEAHQLVDYVFDRPAGDMAQEVGGVMVTLAALCTAICVDMRAAGEAELERVSSPEVMDRVRAKNAAKVRTSPLPGQIAPMESRP